MRFHHMKEEIVKIFKYVLDNNTFIGLLFMIRSITSVAEIHEKFPNEIRGMLNGWKDIVYEKLIEGALSSNGKKNNCKNLNDMR